MVQSIKQMTSEVRQFLYTKIYGMNEENTLSSKDLLTYTAKISMEHKEINNGRTQGYATQVTVLDPKSSQNASSANGETSIAYEEKGPVEMFKEQKMISGNSSFFMTIAGKELPEEIYSLTAAQAELKKAQGIGIKFIKDVDQYGIAHYYRAGKVKIKVDEKFGEVGESIYEKLSWPKGITADSLGKQRPILVNRDVRENMPEGIYGSLKLVRTHPKLVPIITAALSVGLAVSLALGGIGGTNQDKDYQNELENIPGITQVQEQTDVKPIVNEQDNIALGNVFTLSEGVKAFHTAKEAMAGQNDEGNGVAVIGGKYCPTEAKYYIDGIAVVDEQGKVFATNFKTNGLLRDDFVKAVAEENGVSVESLKGIVHYSKVGESLNENGDLVYEGVSVDANGYLVYNKDTNTGWVNLKTVTDGENTYLEGAQMQGSLKDLNMLKTQSDSTVQAGAGTQVELGQ